MDIQLIDEILSDWKDVIGDDYNGYRNHVYRMVTFCLSLGEYSEEDRQKICIAAAFHNIGIWIENTVDYIEPSIPPAMDYLKQNKLNDWCEEIELMISEHHKIRAYRGPYGKLVERFRKADLVDFSLGMFKHGLPSSLIREVKVKYPNCGFHKGLVHKLANWIVQHPLNPTPMIKW